MMTSFFAPCFVMAIKVCGTLLMRGCDGILTETVDERMRWNAALLFATLSPSFLTNSFKVVSKRHLNIFSHGNLIHRHLHPLVLLDTRRPRFYSHRPLQSSSAFAMDTTTLESFLHSIYNEVKSELQSIHSLPQQTSIESLSPRFTAVLGNEAGDADSILSSIGLAYVFQIEQKYCRNTEKNTDADSLDKSSRGTYSFPILSIPRKDMILRRDVTLLLDFCHISSLREFLYIDDIWSKDKEDSFTSIRSLFQPDNGEDQTDSRYSNLLELALVDHNKIRSSLWHLRDRVGQIYDHHCDEGFHTNAHVRNIAFDSSSMIASVGSTCTLVTEELERVLRSSSGVFKDCLDIDPAIGLALLGVILIDTMNMSPEAGKGTERDQHAIHFLMNHTRWDSLVSQDDLQLKSYYEQIFNLCSEPVETFIDTRVMPNRTALYEILRDCKFDPAFWSEMSTEDALRIDYKTFGSPQESFIFGLSSILLPCSALQEKEDFEKSTIHFIKSQRILVLGILSLVVHDNIPRREISLLGPVDIVRSLTRHLISSEDASFLSVSNPNEHSKTFYGDGDDSFLMVTLQQGNSKASRKQIAPIIQSYGSKLKEGNELDTE